MLENYKDVLNVKQVMEILSIGKNTTYKLIYSGELPAFRMGKGYKIPKKCLRQYIIQKANGEI